MPADAITQYRGKDCFQTWFIEECLEWSLYGVGPGSIPSVERIIREGGNFYFEDRPFFHKGGKGQNGRRGHLISGLYRIVPIECPQDKNIVFEFGGEPYIYKSKNPEQGPWIKRSRTREWRDCGIVYTATYPQTPDRYQYYPFRFSFKKVDRGWNKHIKSCGEACELC